MPPHDEWLMRGHAAATITFNDPAWAAQSYEMDRGERARGDYNPPLPSRFVDALRNRQRRLNALEDLMVAQGRTEVPPLELLPAWSPLEGPLLLAGRPLDHHGIRWAPAPLMAEFQALYATPLPCSADLTGDRHV